MRRGCAGWAPLAAATMLTVALAAPGRPALAQADVSTNGSPWYVSVSHWGRWAALAGAVGFTTLAVVRNHDANEVFDGLLTLCANANEACLRSPNGRYVDASAETLYRETIRLDDVARTWMILGQVTLVAAGGMFLIDLVTGDDDPNNIPFSPFEVFATPRGAGLRVRF
ncbi:MAG TPA: hypothetical protein VGA37_17150 [Gemmatimonadales bacterium]